MVKAVINAAAIPARYTRDMVFRGGANPSVELEEVALDELLSANFGDRQHPAYGVQLFNLSAMPGVSPPKTTRPAHYFEDEDGKEEVTALCQRYLDFLDKVLNDFCADHPPA